MNPNLNIFFGGGGARVSEFISKNPNLKKSSGVGGGGRGAGWVGDGGGARVSEIFSKNPSLKKGFFFILGIFFGGRRGVSIQI